jgi:hypothetical protein
LDLGADVGLEDAPAPVDALAAETPANNAAAVDAVEADGLADDLELGADDDLDLDEAPPAAELPTDKASSDLGEADVGGLELEGDMDLGIEAAPTNAPESPTEATPTEGAEEFDAGADESVKGAKKKKAKKAKKAKKDMTEEELEERRKKKAKKKAKKQAKEKAEADELSEGSQDVDDL